MADNTEVERRTSSADIVAGAQAIREKTQQRIESNRKKAKSGNDGGGGAEKADLKAELKMTEHQTDLDELLANYGSHVDEGMTTAAVEARQELEGKNCLTPPAQKPEWLKFLEQLTDFFSLLLWGGAALCFVGYGLKNEQDNLYLGSVLAGVVLATGIFGYFQERKSSNLMDSFKNMMPTLVKVYRDGAICNMNAKELVRGDIIRLKGGDKVPADVRVIECSDDMKVDNASLTGESEPIKREAQCTHENPLETRNLAFFGTLVPSGTCKGVVVNIGDQTVMGRIAALSMVTENVQTPINKEIHHFVKIVSAVAIFLGVSFFIIGALLGTDWITNLVFMIGIIVANVPEGLLATVTVCLTLTAQRMHGKNVLVKNLESVETLGSTSCICSDKTGTLTQNIMTVAHLVFDQAIWNVDSTMGTRNYALDSKSFMALQRCATLCNTAVFDANSKVECYTHGEKAGTPKPGGRKIAFKENITMGDGSKELRIMWKPVGDASESAMIKFCQDKRDIMEFRSKWPLNEKGKIPFNSANKYQTHIHWDSENESYIEEFKGAPERVIARCTEVMVNNGEIAEFTAERRAETDRLQTELSRMGMRVLGFAEKRLDTATFPRDYAFDSENCNFPLGESEADFQTKVDFAAKAGAAAPNEVIKVGLCFLGLMALIDPPRPQVPDAVAKCKTAGIKVIMVTGDHPETAKAIAKKVGIIWGDTREDIQYRNEDNNLNPGDPGYEDPALAPAIVVPGWDIGLDTTEEIWDDILSHSQVVFARTSPQQKLIIVENCQARKHVVAVTGDGVNDSPALKKADIGVAMGIMGTDVSKEAADMILLDDNFASIVAGVEEGRIIFDNLKKSIAYTLSSNIPEISPFLVFICVQVPLPLSTVLILCVDLGTDMIPAISMAWENAEADIMARNPRDPSVDRLVTKKLVCFAYLQIGVIQAVSGFYTWMTVLNDYGYAAHTLPGLGAVDNWGKQTLFCKLDGGSMVDVKGKFCVQPENADCKGKFHPGCVNTCFDQGAIFWTETPKATADPVGKIVDCQFAVRDVLGPATDLTTLYKSAANNVDPAKDADVAKNWRYNKNVMQCGKMEACGDDKSFNTGNTDQVSWNSVNALTAQGYVQYYPWKGRETMFFDRKWVVYPATDAGVNGLGSSVHQTPFFGHQPLGQYSYTKGVGILEDDDKNPVTAYSGHVSDVIKTSKGCDAAAVAEGTECSIDGNKYNKGVFSMKTCVDSSGKAKDGTCDQTGDRSSFPERTTNTDGNAPDGRDMYCGNCDKGGACTKCHADVAGTVPLVNVASRMMQKEALHHAQSASFIAIIIVQWADLVICKTRWLSIRTQGMKNATMNFALLWETCLGALLCYIPQIGVALGTRPLRFTHWCTGVPFSIFIFLYDETRKYLMRRTSFSTTDKETGRTMRFPGWLERNTYY